MDAVQQGKGWQRHDDELDGALMTVDGGIGDVLNKLKKRSGLWEGGGGFPVNVRLQGFQHLRNALHTDGLQLGFKVLDRSSRSGRIGLHIGPKKVAHVVNQSFQVPEHGHGLRILKNTLLFRELSTGVSGHFQLSLDALEVFNRAVNAAGKIGHDGTLR
jgi:hypothetical protein